MSSEVQNSAVADELPPASCYQELQSIEESEFENCSSESKIASLKEIQANEGSESADSDVCLNYDSSSNEKECTKENLSADNETTDSERDKEKDSGCEVSKADGKSMQKKNQKSQEDEDSSFEPPDDELAARIVAQVEFYFSDENIAKDAFLLKHVRRNKEGYVSLKLISSFKRVKHLAKDWRAVAHALKKSTKLEVNEAQTKLRRLSPLPAFDQTPPSRTIFAVNLPMQKPTIENVAEIFRDFGEIALIRILRPGTSIPAGFRPFANKHPEILETMSALIEFDRTESAKMAIDRYSGDWRSPIQGMKVIEVNGAGSEKKKRSQSKKTALNRLIGEELSSSCQSGSEPEFDAKFYRRRSSSPNPMNRKVDGPRLQRRYSANRESGINFTGHDLFQERPACACCHHCERSYSSSGSGYDSPVAGNYRRYSLGKEAQETGYQIPALRRYSGAEGSCCLLRRGSRDSGSESSGSFPRPHDLGRRFSRDSTSSSENGLQRRFSRDSISSDTVGIYRRSSRDSIGSDVFAPPFLPRANSKDAIEMPRRGSYGSALSCTHHPLAHAGIRNSFFAQGNCSQTCSPHVPENVVRMPKGPDGSRGFVTAQ